MEESSVILLTTISSCETFLSFKCLIGDRTLMKAGLVSKSSSVVESPC